MLRVQLAPVGGHVICINKSTMPPNNLTVTAEARATDKSFTNIKKKNANSMSAGMAVKSEGKANGLLDRVAADPPFEAEHDKLESLVDSAILIAWRVKQVSILSFFL